MLTPTHALHNDRRRLVWNMEHFSLDGVWSPMQELHHVRRSMHPRFSLEGQSLHNVRRRTSLHGHWNRLTQTSCQPWTPNELLCTWKTVFTLCTISMEHVVSHEKKTIYIKQFETMALTRQSNEVGGNHIDPGKDFLVIDKTKVFLDLWQSTRSESLHQTISCHLGGRLIGELNPSP